MRRLAAALCVALPAAAGAQTSAPATPAPTQGPARPAAAPVASPRDTARGTVGSVNVLVDYGRPYKKGRVIFGPAPAALQPFGKVWRAGANAATTLVTSGDLVVGDSTRLPAGTYTLYAVPGPTQWQLVINKQTGQWGTVYNQAQDFARVPVQPTKAPLTEQFTIRVPGNALVLQWDTTAVSVPLRPFGSR